MFDMVQVATFFVWAVVDSRTALIFGLGMFHE